MRTKTNFEKCAKPAKQNHHECLTQWGKTKKAKQTFSNHVGCHQVTLHLFQFVQSSTPLSRNLEQMQKRAPRPNHRQRRRRLCISHLLREKESSKTLGKWHKLPGFFDSPHKASPTNFLTTMYEKAQSDRPEPLLLSERESVNRTSHHHHQERRRVPCTPSDFLPLRFFPFFCKTRELPCRKFFFTLRIFWLHEFASTSYLARRRRTFCDDWQDREL